MGSEKVKTATLPTASRMEGIKPACKLKILSVARKMAISMVDLSAVIWQRKRQETEEKRKREERFLQRREEKRKWLVAKKLLTRRLDEEDLVAEISEKIQKRRLMMKREAAERRRRIIRFVVRSLGKVKHAHDKTGSPPDLKKVNQQVGWGT